VTPFRPDVVYQKIVDNETYTATVFPKQAQLRLDALDDNAESFTFVQLPESIKKMMQGNQTPVQTAPAEIIKPTENEASTTEIPQAPETETNTE